MKMMKFTVGIAVAALWACGGGSGSEATGSLHVRAGLQQVMGPAGVNDVKMTLTPVSGAFAPIEHQVLPNGLGEYSFTLDKVFVGAYDLMAEAFAADGTLLYALDEPLRVVVNAREITEVTLNLLEVNKRPYDNHAPYITSLIASANQIDNATTINLAAKVSHHTDDPSEKIAYKWVDNAAGGTFSAADALETAWTPPAADGTYTLTFSAEDSHEAKASLAISIEVAQKFGKGTIVAVLGFNNSPFVTKITAFNTQAVVNQPIDLTAYATDLDGDYIKFAWADTSGCGHVDPTVARTSAIADVVPPNDHYEFTPVKTGFCTITVTVSDFADAELTKPRNGQNIAQFHFWVGETVKPAVGPQFMVRISSPNTLYAGDKVDVQVIPMNKSSDWTYEWSDGSFGGRFEIRTDAGFTDGSDHYYFAPTSCDAPTGKIPMSVLVTDTATSASNLEEFELNFGGCIVN